MSTRVGTYNLNPLKFGLWLGLASIGMMFVAFTSAYVVRQAAGNWLEFQIPTIFFYSSAVIIASSITLHVSYISFKKEKFGLYKALLGLTMILGLLFVVLQYQGWQTLYSIGIELTGNPAGSFLYIISGVHAAHILGGISGLFVALYQAFSLDNYVSSKRKLRFELLLHYWHFVDFLWIYLLIFFIIQR